MATEIEVLADEAIIIVRWLPPYQGGRDLKALNRRLRSEFEAQGWEQLSIIQDLTEESFRFGDLLMALGELRSEDSRFLSARSHTIVAGQSKLIDMVVAANGQSQYGEERRLDVAPSVADALYMIRHYTSVM
ncbi:MAG: hypothetical protein GYB68_04395 [Chloroflexi bacterium]|nr:hypothetical protein [Chloroflexota bacterium]